MMVTFVSQCEKKALGRTRKVLDAFADRIGSNTWQTVITQDGLLAVKKQLRRTASKNTAVSCHWLRSRSRSELVWVVGQKNKFNRLGIVPVNSTHRDILRSSIENDWPYLPLIKALTALSALMHDWGKASQLFQKKLIPSKNKTFKGDPIRHEWISCLLLDAFITLHKQGEHPLTDEYWLTALSEGNINEENIAAVALKQNKKPLAQLPPLAQLICWLVVSHHRLPLMNDNNLMGLSCATLGEILDLVTQEWGYENKYDEHDYQQRVKQCFAFNKGLMSCSKPWLKEVKKWSKRLLACQDLAQSAFEDNTYRLVLNHARLCLMLGDHYYSSQDAAQRWKDTTGLYANTDRNSGELKQKLDEHLVGVAKQGVHNAHRLPDFEIKPPGADSTPALKKLSPVGYQWQDKAVDAIKSYLSQSDKKQGFFIVNMASTGCGKTFANAKVMRILSKDGDSLRFILALGLRTLTLQTGDEYRERVGLDNSDLAVLIGSKAVTELHHQKNISKASNLLEYSGSESEETLLDEALDYDGTIPEQGLDTVLTSERDRKFLYAPVLACTIDHLMAATETKRGGRYILPTLRLMSSDLVIDEIDDFTGNDLIAIGRLIHLAGMLGRKVMISSATIPPDLAEGYFKTYRDGWQIHSNSRNAVKTIACTWIDEFNSHVSANTEVEDKDAILEYRAQHNKFVKKRVAKLLKQPTKRKATISPCDRIFSDYKGHHDDADVINSKQEAYFSIAFKSAFDLHQQHHTIDNKTKLAVSFGVIRVANIQPCIALTQYLLSADCPKDTDIRVMAYHSQQVLLLRHEQEQHLDQVLKRKEKEGAQPQSFSDPIIRQHLNDICCNDKKIKHCLFIVVATPVEEVGRDHDFDWAVVEPSSYRSIIQLAGRVRRHRKTAVNTANVSLMQYNWRGIRDNHKDKNKPFSRPGFELKGQLDSHDLNRLLDTNAIMQRLDAIPRIKKAEPLKPTLQLADLEHSMTKRWLASYNKSGDHAQIGPATLQGYLREPWFLTALPQTFTPFRQSQPDLKIFLVFDYDSEQCRFCEKNDRGDFIEREVLLGIRRIEMNSSQRTRLWITRDYEASIQQMAVNQERSLRGVSIRYGEISFRYKDGQTYLYSDQLGLMEQ